MELNGQIISHIKYGRGIIKNTGENYIIAVFSNEEKKFIYPTAFRNYLTMEDKKLQSQIDKILERVEANSFESNKPEHQRKMSLEYIHPDSQAAFGFVQNSKEEVFSSWSVYAGSYQTGGSKGKPKLPLRLKINSACLLTECPKGTTEKKRRILGVFMPKEEFEGTACRDGRIQSHEKYRIKLEEKETMLFWNYITEENQAPKWGNIELKYLSNITMQYILQDMKHMISGTKRRQEAEALYRYYCLVNGLEDMKP